MSPDSIPKANVIDSIAVFNEVIAPTAAKGVIIRRPSMVALAQRMEWDARAVKRLQKLRREHGDGPVLLSTPGQPRAVVLSPQHVRRILEETPDVFSTASSEKTTALSHFEPKNALISEGWRQADRQRFNDEVLDSGRDVHRMAEVFLRYIDEEADYLHARTIRSGALDWDDFFVSWFRVIRRSVLGDSAADDQEVTSMLEKLREAGNWAFMHPGLPRLRERFHDRIKLYLERGEEGSLAARAQEVAKTGRTKPHHQVPQYLFASDPAGMATFRTLALIAAHPEVQDRVQAEVDAHNGKERGNLPLLRACVLESLRLWPTSPLILRESRQETTWDGRVMPKGTGLVIFAPFFHRDDERLDFAHRFTPDLWLDGEREHGWTLIPFSGGPAICPGRNFVLLMTSGMIAALLDGHEVRLSPPDLVRGDRPPPGTLDHFNLRFVFTERRKKAAARATRAQREPEEETAPVPVRGVGLLRAHAGHDDVR